SLDDRIVALVADFVAAVGTAGQEEPAQILRGDQLAHFTVEHLGIRRGNHRLENLRLTVIAVQCTSAGCHRKRGKAVLAATLELATRIGLERGRRETDRPE